MSDQRVGSALRAVRVRRGWRQADIASRAGVSTSLVSAVERGHLSTVTVETLRRVAAALEIRLDVVARWRGGELDRMLNRRRSALADAVARFLAQDGWEVAPEVSFAVYGERGWIDLLAWHAPSRSLLVIELKTEVVDIQELIGVVDRKTRLARQIGSARGWLPAVVGTWVVIAEGSTNRHRVARFDALPRAAFPADRRALRGWLRKPVGSIHALSFFSNSTPGATKQSFSGRQRVHVAKR